MKQEILDAIKQHAEGNIAKAKANVNANASAKNKAYCISSEGK